ncbi:DUF7507 domain-containing protein [Algoriphagus sanaruensis]|uniref:PKD domain-containing protein n=1 Tax=Algoriphagus sanaruensis TaxID=1727163 RepID=A0A142EJ18_9BACT|nr:gliding motility-associated C-terminal domain-containing protein [Algoriphagus sanaruensis]AMQ55123.1 hypothetical protein AO498_01870 [Algoriphagus sanaruensis]
MDRLSNNQFARSFMGNGFLNQLKPLRFYGLLVWIFLLIAVLPSFGQTENDLKAVQVKPDIIPAIDFNALKSSSNARMLRTTAPLNGRVQSETEFCSGGVPPLSFQNPTYLGNPNGGSGANLNPGASYRFSNVVTLPGGTVVDAIVTIEDEVRSKISAFDDTDSGYPTALQPILSGDGSTRRDNNGWATFRYEFVLSGTSTPVTIPNFTAYLIDIDGDSNFHEFQAVSAGNGSLGNISFGNGAEDNLDELSEPAPFGTRYQDNTGSSAESGGNPIPTNVFERIVKVDFVNIQTFRWRFGLRYRRSEAQNSRYFSFYVSCIDDFQVGAADYGDAPASYGTPSHTTPSNVSPSNITPRFGAIVDRENGSFPSVNADGDDLNSDDPSSTEDDEDGISFSGSFDANQNKTITVNTRGTGQINAWIDWNRDGDFNDAGEQIVTNQAVSGTSTNTQLQIPVPCDAVPGDSYMRFRINTAGGLGPDGGALNGEVEDYKITIASTIVPITFTDQPDPATYCVNQNAAPLEVVVSGTGTKTYQWYSNTTNSNTGGTLINGATNSTYTPSTTQIGETWYYVVVTGNCRSATSNTANITVNALPTIDPIQGQDVCVGGTSQMESGTLGGIWGTTTPNLISISDEGLVTGIAVGQANVTYTVTENNCTSTVNKTVVVNSLAEAPEGLSFSVAKNSGNYEFKANKKNSNNTLRWYDSPAGGTPLNGTPSINSNTLGTYKKYVSEVNAAGCESPIVEAMILVSEGPDFPPCEPEDFNCTTNNLNFPAVYLSDVNGNRITGTCEDGVQQDVYITVEIQQNSNTARYETRLFAKLFIGESATPIQINSYIGLIDVGAQGVVKRVIQKIDGWQCGDELRMTNILLVWLTNPNSIPVDCGDYNKAQSECLDEIFVSAPLSADIDYTSCYGDSGYTFYFTSDVNGGVSPYTYAWDFNNDGIIDNTTANPVHTYSDNSASQVRLVVTDSQNPAVSVTRIEDLSYPTAFDVETEITAPTCSVAVGSITVGQVSGATYSIDGQNYQESNTFNNLTPGLYTVRVKLSNECIRTAQVSVPDQPVTPGSPTTSLTQPTCEVATGAITVSAPTGNNFTYSIDGVDYQDSNVFNNLNPGQYSVTVKSADGCISSPAVVTINPQPVPVVLNPGINGDLILCEGASPTESQLFAALGGSPDTGGIWTNVGNVYTYTLSSNSPCPVEATATVTVSYQDGPDAGGNGTLTLCEGTTPTESELFAALTGTPDAGGSWSNVGNVYTYTVAATAPCTEAATATVTVSYQDGPDAGGNGTLTLCEGTTPTESELFAALTGTPDAGGSWSNVGNVYTYTVAATAPCTEAATATVTVSYQDGPDAGGNGTLTLCEGTTPTESELFAALTGTPDAGGSWSNDGNVYTYTVAATAPCTEAATATVTVSYQDGPDAGGNGTLTLCEGTTPTESELFAALTGTPDAGGSWSNDGNVYTYTVAATAPCTEAATATVTVSYQDGPDAGDNGTLTLCEGTTPTESELFAALTGTPDAGGSWSNDGNVYTYTVAATAPCTEAATATVTVSYQDGPDAGGNGTLTLCEGTTPTESELFAALTGTPDAGGSWSNDGNVYTYTVAATAPCTEAATATVTVSYQDGPDAGGNGTLTLCEGTTPTESELFAALTGTPDAGGSWSNDGNVYTYTVAATAPCTEAATATVTVSYQDGPDAGGNGTLTLCEGSTPTESELFAALTGTPDAGGSWSNDGNVYTYTVAATAPCTEAATATVTVSYQDGPDAGGNGTLTLCEGTTPTESELFAALTGTPDAGGSWSNVGNVYTYTVAATAPCTEAATATVTVSYQDGPDAGGNGTLTLCEGSTPTESELFAALTGTPDAGGSWSNVGNVYTYTVAATAPCTEAATATVTVSYQDGPDAGGNGTLTLCEGTTPTESELFAALTGTPDAGGSWSNDGNVYTYTVAATAPCTEAATATVTVSYQDGPDAGDNGTLTLCEGTTPTESELFAALTGTPDAGGSWSNDGNVYTYTVAATAPCTEAATATVTVSYQDGPDAGGNGTLTLCEGTTPTESELFAALTGTPDAGGSWSNDGNVYTYTVAATAPCTEAATATVTVSYQDGPDAGGNGTLTLCEGTTPTESELFAALTGTPDAGGSWSNDGNVYTYTVAATAPCTEAATATVTVSYQDGPDAGGNGTLTLCEGSTPTESELFAALTGTPDAGGSWSNDGNVYTYTVAATAPCTEAATATVTVSYQDGPDAGGNGTLTLCEGTTPTESELFAALTGTPDAGGSWSNVGNVYTYTVAATAPCTEAATATVTVSYQDGPDAGGNGTLTLCEGTTPTESELFAALTGTPDAGGSWSNVGNVYTYTVAATAPCTEAATATVTVSYQDGPDAGGNGTLTLCEGTTPTESELFAALTGTPDAGGSWSNDGNVYTYTVAATAPCTEAATATVTVSYQDGPDAGGNGTLTLCEGTTPTESELFAALTGTPDAGGSWSNVGNVYTYTVAATAPCTEAATATVTVSYQDGPDAGGNGTLTLCEGTTPTESELFAALTGTPDAGGSWSNVGNVYTYTVAATAPCTEAATATVTVSYQDGPDAGGNGTLTLCEGTTPTESELFAALTGTPDAGGSWSNVGNVYTYTVAATAPCTEAATATVTVSYYEVEAPVSKGNQTVCAIDPVQELIAEVTVNENETIRWYSSVESLTPIQGLPTLNEIGTVTYWAEAVSEFGCVSKRTPVTLTINDCSLSIVKSGEFVDENSDNLANEGETIKYTFLVTNTGNVKLTGVTVTDPMVTVNGGPIDLEVGEDSGLTFTATYTLTQDDIDAGIVRNTATADSNETGPSSDDEETILPQEKGINVTKTSSLEVDGESDCYEVIAGETVITYTFTVTNTGNVSLGGVEVTDEMPNLSAIEFVEGDSDEDGELDVTETWTYKATYTVTQKDVDAGMIENSVEVTTNDETVSDTDSLTLTLCQDKGINVIKTSNLEVDGESDCYEVIAGETVITYTFTVTNTGNVSLGGVEVTDEMPNLSAIEFVAGDSDEDGELDVTETWTYKATYTVTQEDVDAGMIENSVEVTTNDETVSDTDSLTLTLCQDKGINVTKTSSLEVDGESDCYEVIAGETVITYTFTVTNTGNVSLGGVEVTDEMPNLSAIEFVEGDSDEDGELDVTETWTYKATYTVTQKDVDAGMIENSVEVTTNDETVSDTDSLILTLCQNQSLAINKTVASNADVLGGDLVFNVTVKNTGNTTLFNIYVEDIKTGDNWMITELAPNAEDTRQVIVEISQELIDGGCYENTAIAEIREYFGEQLPSEGLEEDAYEVILSAEPSTVTECFTQTPGIQIVKTDNGAEVDAAGDLITYTLTATNTGNVTLTNVVITDPLTGYEENVGTLNPGQSAIRTTSYTVTQSDVNAGFVLNTALTTGDSPDGNDPSDETEEETPIQRNPSIQIVKTDNGAEVDAAGDVITYTLTATNTGNVTLTNVVITDPLTGYEENVGTLNPGQSAIRTTSYTVTQSDVNAGFVLNTALTTGDSPDGNDPSDETEEETPIQRNPSIQIVKTDNGAEVDAAGDVITYTLTATNTGNVTLTNVVITDPLTGYEENVGTLNPGQSAIRTTSYTVTQSDVNAGFVLNTALATGDSPDGNDPSDETEEETPIQRNPSIQIVKTDNGAEVDAAGDVITYTLIATNTGNVTLTNVVITDPLTGYEENVGTLNPGQSAIRTTSYTVTQSDVNAGFVLNTALTTGDSPDGNDPSDETEEETPIQRNPSIQIVKTDNGAEVDAAGDVITYTLTATNTGNVTLTNVVITDPLTGYEENVGTLNPGQSAIRTTSYTVTQSDVNAGFVLNTALTTGDSPDGNDPSDETEEETPIQRNPSIQIVKTDNGAEVDAAGDVITYTLTATNTGNVTLTNVVITDPLTGYEENVGTLNPGQSAIRTTSYTVTQSDVNAGFVLNTALTTGDSPDGDDPSDEVEVETPIARRTDIQITKVADVEGVQDEGEVINYTITVTNIGNITLTSVSVEDPKTGLSEVIDVLEPGQAVSFETSYIVTIDDVAAQETIVNVATATYTDPVTEEERSEEAEELVEILCMDRTLITGTIFNDMTGEPLVGVPVTLIPQGSTPGTIKIVVTGADGRYSFKDFPAGSYLLQVQDANLNATRGLYPVASSLFFTDIEVCIYQTKNFGYGTYDGPVLGDFVWYDLNGDGIQNEWFDANNDGQVTQNPIQGQAIDISEWEWFDLNGDGRYDGPENEGELNKAGFGNAQSANIKVTGPNGFENDVIVGILGYWRTRPEAGFGDYTATLTIDEFLDTEAQRMRGTGLVKVLPDAGARIMGINASRTEVRCGVTTGNEITRTVISDQLVFLDMDFGIRCLDVEVEIIANNDDFGAHFISFGGVIGNILDNDLLEGQRPDPDDVDFEFTELDGIIGLLIDENGELSLIPGVNEVRSYTLGYTLRETLFPDNSDDATVVFRILNDNVDLSVTKTSFGAEIYEGDEFEYEIVVRNIGGTPASGVTIVDNLPASLTYLSSRVASVSDSQIQVGAPTVSGSTITWNVPFIPADGVVTIRITVKAGNAGSIQNVVVVDSEEDDTNDANNSATDVNQVLPFRIPNVITPNNDGDNDTFEIKGLGKFASSEIVIFNRYGDHVLEKKNYQNDWNAPGQVAGTYYYVLKLTDQSGKVHEYTGWIQVIKE